MRSYSDTVERADRLLSVKRGRLFGLLFEMFGLVEARLGENDVGVEDLDADETGILPVERDKDVGYRAASSSSWCCGRTAGAAR
jgi:hypothetical protein